MDDNKFYVIAYALLKGLEVGAKEAAQLIEDSVSGGVEQEVLAEERTTPVLDTIEDFDDEDPVPKKKTKKEKQIDPTEEDFDGIEDFDDEDEDEEEEKKPKPSKVTRGSKKSNKPKKEAPVIADIDDDWDDD